MLLGLTLVLLFAMPVAYTTAIILYAKRFPGWRKTPAGIGQMILLASFDVLVILSCLARFTSGWEYWQGVQAVVFAILLGAGIWTAVTIEQTYRDREYAGTLDDAPGRADDSKHRN